MRQIVVNKCYGGFGLSHKAVMRYSEIKGISLYPFVDKRDPNGRLLSDRKYEPYTNQQAWLIHYGTKPLAGGAYEQDSYFVPRDIGRNDLALIAVVQELGDAANGECAELEIVEIPDGVEWEIEEYDGQEWIAEKHRTW